MAKLPDPAAHRRPEREIEPIFWRRWSPRAMTGEAVSQSELDRMLEAARWAPSTYNEQEWRFLYAHRDGPYWKMFFDLLVEANQVWCRSAGVLVVVLAHRVFSMNGKPNPVHVLDTGAALQNFQLQGSQMGLVVHGMAGFHADRARAALKVPDDFGVEAMVAIGRPGDPEKLPAELREREVPSGRKRVEEISREGPFAF